MIIGIVGKPSVGKSTFFKASTLSEVDIANYPFTTIQANHAVGFVKIKDVASEFGKVAHPRAGYVQEGWRFVPVNLVDVAGLVPGAHKGEGMGGQFLNDLNQADALIHVIDISGSVNERGESVQPGSYDPANDIEFLEVELDHWYLGILEKGWEKLSRQAQQEKQAIEKVLTKQLNGLGVTETIAQQSLVETGLSDKAVGQWSEEELLSLARAMRKRSKPILIAANKADHPEGKKNLARIQEQFLEYHIIPTSAQAELALREAQKKELIHYVPGSQTFEVVGTLSPAQEQGLQFIQKELLEEYETGTGVQAVLNGAVFDLLKRKAIHPGGVSKLEDSNGNVLPDCFLMKEQATALDFAYALHTDFGKNFVKAIDVKRKIPVGKDHVLKHLDIVEIMSTK